MKERTPINLAASVRARLTAQAKTSARPFDEVLQHYAIERFLYRLSRSAYAESYVLKGALLLRSHGGPSARPPRDIDVLGRRHDEAVEHIEGVVRDCLAVPVADGMRFDPDSVRSETITAAANHPGVRVLFMGYLETARAAMQIDVGFGDAVSPGPIWIEYPEMLDYGTPRLLGYTLESVIAEKYQALVALGMVNTRMKDFYDLMYLSSNFDFEGPPLARAIQQTFTRRGTPMPTVPPTAFTDAFFDDPTKQKQWEGFTRKTRLTDVPHLLRDVVLQIAPFLLPPSTAAGRDEDFAASWTESGPWQGG